MVVVVELIDPVVEVVDIVESVVLFVVFIVARISKNMEQSHIIVMIVIVSQRGRTVKSIMQTNMSQRHSMVCLALNEDFTDFTKDL